MRRLGVSGKGFGRIGFRLFQAGSFEAVGWESRVIFQLVVPVFGHNSPLGIDQAIADKLACFWVDPDGFGSNDGVIGVGCAFAEKHLAG